MIFGKGLGNRTHKSDLTWKLSGHNNHQNNFGQLLQEEEKVSKLSDLFDRKVKMDFY